MKALKDFDDLEIKNLEKGWIWKLIFKSYA